MKRRRGKSWRKVSRLLLAGLLLTGAASAFAQTPGHPPDGPPGPTPLSLHRLSDLDFGKVTAGREQAITPAEPEAAHFEVRGPPMSHIRVQWDLPPSLAGISLTFDSNSAAWAPTSAAAQQIRFDPNHDILIRIPDAGVVFLWLGGQARPASQQESGPFSENISLTVTLEPN